jgi:hypothetical protein
MTPRLNTPPEAASDPFQDSEAFNSPTSGCAALTALSSLAARTVLRGCPAWGLLESNVQACLLRRVSNNDDASAFRAALAVLLQSSEWSAGRFVQKAALERLATLTSFSGWFNVGEDSATH